MQPLRCTFALTRCLFMPTVVTPAAERPACLRQRLRSHALARICALSPEAHHSAALVRTAASRDRRRELRGDVTAWSSAGPDCTQPPGPPQCPPMSAVTRSFPPFQARCPSIWRRWPPGGAVSSRQAASLTAHQATSVCVRGTAGSEGWILFQLIQHAGS